MKTLLLSPGVYNSKLKKTETVNSCKIYYLQLATASDGQFYKIKNCCPAATKECIQYCLRNTGCYKLFEKVTACKRIMNTSLLQNNKEAFLNLLKNDLEALASIMKEKVYIRLHTLGEYPFDLDKDFVKIIKSYKNIMFYDYYKMKERKGLENYKLCFSNPIVYGSHYLSWSKKSREAEAYAYKQLEKGKWASFIFKGEVPEKWKGYDVEKGDASDLFFLRNPGKIQGLKYKGNQELF